MGFKSGENADHSVRVISLIESIRYDVRPIAPPKQTYMMFHNDVPLDLAYHGSKLNKT
ncbi:hypothetical protein TNCV_3518211, partial [Trichonephila clavipes]